VTYGSRVWRLLEWRLPARMTWGCAVGGGLFTREIDYLRSEVMRLMPRIFCGVGPSWACSLAPWNNKLLKDYL
jgi:hypothetical protein